MTYMTPFEKQQEEQKVSPKEDKPNLPWSSSVFLKVNNQPRQPLESPLKRWWLEQQKKGMDV